MKRLLLLLLVVLMMCLTQVTVFAYGDGSISLIKTTYAPNEEIVVYVDGITEQMVEDEAYISIYKKGAAHNQYMNWDRPEVGSSELVLDAPSEGGSYEVRLYRKDHEYTDETFVVSVSFEVMIAKQGKISLEKNAYQAQEEISVNVTDITQDMEKSSAYVSIYKKGAKHNEYGVYQYILAGDSVVKLEAPNLNGEFEMRLYSINHNYSDESFVMSVPFTLSGAVANNISKISLMHLQFK